MSGTITWWDAWSVWFSGQEVDPQLRMWGLSILWWGRFGKIAGFLAGTTIVLDLIGPDRMRAFASRLPRWDDQFELLIDVMRRYFGDEHYVRRPEKPGPMRPRVNYLPFSILTYGATLVLTIITFMRWDYPWWGVILSAIPVFFFCMLVAVLGFGLIAGILVSIPMFAIEGTIRVLDTDRPAHTIRYVALALFVAGFHLDLLAS